LVDCSFMGGYGNLGCSGGLMDSAFQYVHDKGTELESDYPYKAKRATCQESSHPIQFQITGFTDVTPNSVDALKAAVAQ